MICSPTPLHHWTRHVAATVSLVLPVPGHNFKHASSLLLRFGLRLKAGSLLESSLGDLLAIPGRLGGGAGI